MNASDLTTKILTCQRRLPAALSAILLALITSSASADLDVDNTTRITPVSVQPIAIQPSVAQSSPIQSTTTDLITIAPVMDSSTYIISRCEDNRQNRDSKYQTELQRDIVCMIDQLQPYQQANITTRQQYLAYKAQAWLNYANNKYSMNSRASIADYAFESGKEIFLVLKNNDEQNINLVRDIPTTSDMMRPDLWATLSALKAAGGIDSAPRELAFSEVSLIWAAADHCARGWRESSPRFRMADRWLEQAREAYVNAHDSQSNVALEDATVDYYTQYAPLDPSDDICRGQILPLASANNMSSSRPINMPTPTATYSLSFE